MTYPSAMICLIFNMARAFRSMAVVMNATVQLSWSATWYRENSNAEKYECVIPVPSAMN